MTFLKVNNRPVAKTFDGLLNELFGNFDNNPGYTVKGDVPPVNIAETDEGFNLDLAAPGRNKDNFKLQLENNLLTISYEGVKTGEAGEAKELKHIRKEFATDAFKRSFSLDEKVNGDGILAKYEDGVLKLFIPRKPEVKPAVKDITIG